MSAFEKWFEEQFGSLPDPERLLELKNQSWEHVNALNKIGAEIKDLERLADTWDAALYAWQARERLNP